MELHGFIITSKVVIITIIIVIDIVIITIIIKQSTVNFKMSLAVIIKINNITAIATVVIVKYFTIVQQ